MGRVRIKDIAQMAGVSIGTVDRVLHNRGEVAEETKKKIEALAKAVNYKPNLHARAIALKREFKLVVMLPSTEDNPYWREHEAGIVSQVAEYDEGFLFNVHIEHFDMFNEESFRQKCEKVLATMNPQAVVFAPIFQAEALEFAQHLNHMQIPYVLIDTFVEGTQCLGFIGEDANQSGRVAASIVDFGVAPNKDILIVNMAKNLDNSAHLSARNAGFNSFFDGEHSRNKSQRITMRLTTDEPIELRRQLEQYLHINPNIGGVWVSGSKAYKVAECLEQMNRRDLIVVGHDALDANVEYLRKGYINFLIEQQPRQQSIKAVQTIFNYVAYRLRPDFEYRPVEIVNAENVEFFLPEGTGVKSETE